jgi:hypothetical protein
MRGFVLASLFVLLCASMEAQMVTVGNGVGRRGVGVGLLLSRR